MLRHAQTSYRYSDKAVRFPPMRAAWTCDRDAARHRMRSRRGSRNSPVSLGRRERRDSPRTFALQHRPGTAMVRPERVFQFYATQNHGYATHTTRSGNSCVCQDRCNPPINKWLGDQECPCGIFEMSRAPKNRQPRRSNFSTCSNVRRPPAHGAIVLRRPVLLETLISDRLTAVRPSRPGPPRRCGPHAGA